MTSFLNHRQQFLIAIMLLLIGFNACTTKRESKSKLTEYGPVFENIIRSDTGAFRGFNLGDELDSIQAKEVAKLIEKDQDYLYYESKIDDTTGSYNISYTFDERGLNEIQCNIFINDVDNSDVVFNKMKTYFDKNYGSSETHNMGFNVWTVKSEKYGEIRINLSDESTDFTTDKAPGKISLWIYPDKQ